MINFIGILVLIFLEATMIMAIVIFFKHKIDLKEEEILQRDKELGSRTEMVKVRNKIIREKQLRIEELENENKELKRANNKRLRKDS